jgi:hypothetical protein
MHSSPHITKMPNKFQKTRASKRVRLSAVGRVSSKSIARAGAEADPQFAYL